jgi:Phosphotransferase enzyme family
MSGFIKHYPSIEATEAALLRATTARQAGVRTPSVLERIGPRTLGFEHIAATGLPDPVALLPVLAPLNRMPHLGLTRFDPFLRIRPRLPGAPPQVLDLAHRLMAEDAGLNWPQTAVIHGDFHPGQVLCDARGLLWLVDLDDLALAPPEADLGNLTAWMATQGLQDLSAPEQGLAPGADPALTRHFFDIALLRRALKLAEKGQKDVLNRLALRA